METRDRLRKLSRYELVELIYELRKDNLELEDKLKEAERKLAAAKSGESLEGITERLSAIEQVLARLAGPAGASE